jgi:hypothetical protein
LSIFVAPAFISMHYDEFNKTSEDTRPNDDNPSDEDWSTATDSVSKRRRTGAQQATGGF